MIKYILLVDDDESLLNIEGEFLSNYGYDVIKAISGTNALEIFNNKAQIDLIITDKQMKDISGIELIRNIRQKDNDIPIILTSGSFIEDECGDFDMSIKAYFLPKPYRIKKLLNLIKNIGEGIC